MSNTTRPDSAECPYDTEASISTSNSSIRLDAPDENESRVVPAPRDPGYSAGMASDPVFSSFPDPSEQLSAAMHQHNEDVDKFVQKQYPMLYLKLNADQQPGIEDMELCPPQQCRLCKLDRNTADAIKVLKPHEVRPFLVSSGHTFTVEEVNVHLGHSVTSEESMIGVLQNMSIDMIARSYTLANRTSLHIMNQVTTHLGKKILLPDQDWAKIHNDAVKQFIGLTAACRSLLKHKPVEDNTDKGGGHPLL